MTSPGNHSLRQTKCLCHQKKNGSSEGGGGGERAKKKERGGEGEKSVDVRWLCEGFDVFGPHLGIILAKRPPDDKLL